MFAISSLKMANRPSQRDTLTNVKMEGNLVQTSVKRLENDGEAT